MPSVTVPAADAVPVSSEVLTSNAAAVSDVTVFSTAVPSDPTESTDPAVLSVSAGAEETADAEDADTVFPAAITVLVLHAPVTAVAAQRIPAKILSRSE